MLKQSYDIPPLPPAAEFETVAILKALAIAHRHLGEMKGRASAIPNQRILIDTLSLQEARASSEIENIVTTQDELFQADLFPDAAGSAAAKEVALYRDTLRQGAEDLARSGLITNATIIRMFQTLKRHDGGFRTTPGTALRHDRTGAIVYVPPQNGADIIAHMTALERFINEDDVSSLDPLIKMAIIHHQFESIHPFPDGNGRLGRIINVLYLTRAGLLDIPVLYLSRHITRNKNDYYRLLQAVRDTGAWQDWVLYMLEGVAVSAQITLTLIEGIRSLMAATKKRLREELPNLYSQDLLNNLYRHPYTRIDFVAGDLGVTRQTAAKRLDTLAEHGFVTKVQAGRANYYVNTGLVALLMRVSEEA
ncbi:MAG: Fic family protein [Rhizobiales bacterium]|nr:Fic family protein [Hyphomicrobiales bacterium]